MMTQPPEYKTSTAILNEMYGDVSFISKVLTWFTTLVGVGQVTGMFILFSKDEIVLAGILLVSLPLVGASYYFIYWQKFELVSVTLSIFLITMNTVLPSDGMGIHSINTIAYPVILMVASLLCGRRTVIILTLYTLACVTWRIVRETSGVYSPNVHAHSVAGDFFTVAIIVVSTVFIISRLSEALTKSFIRLRKEAEERKSVEKDLRQREVIFETVAFAAEQFLIMPAWRSNIDPVLERLGRALDVTHAYLFEDHLGPNGEALTSMRYEWTAPGYPSDLDGQYFQNSRLDQKGFEDQAAALRRGDVRIGNTSTFNPVEKADMDLLGVKSLLEVPIFVNGREWGAIGFDDFEQERNWSSAEVDVLKIAAGILGGAIQRDSAEAAVHESERIYRQAIEAAGAVPYYQDYKKNSYAFYSENIRKITGYEPDEITPLAWGGMVQEEILMGELAGMSDGEAVLKARSGEVRAWKCDYKILTRDGQVRWVADTSIELFGDHGTSYGSIGIMQDISDRKRIEASLRQREAVLEAITFAAEKFLKSSDWRANINVALERLGRSFDVTHAYLFEHHLDANGVEVSSLRFEWTAPGFASDLNNPLFQSSHPLQAGRNTTNDRLRRGEVFIGNLSTFPEIERERLANLGVKAMVEVPLFVHDSWWGTIGFDDMVNERNWSSAEVDALRVAAGILGAAVQRQLDEDALKRELLERRRTEQKYRDIFNNSMDGIFQSTEDGRFLSVNPAMARIYGYDSPEEMLDSVNDIVNQIYVHSEQRADVLQRLSSGERLLGYETLDYRKDGSTFWCSMSAQAIVDENGKILYYEGTVEDISPRKKAEVDREALIQELANKNAELEQFTYTVSHDLKSPLVTINGFLGYLEQDAFSGNLDRLKKDMFRIQEAVHKMQRLLSELLELSRIGRMMNLPETIPFRELIGDALDMVRGRLDEKGVTVQIHPDLPVVYGDRQRLVEVLQNLIDNAAKYVGGQSAPLIEIGQRGEEKGLSVFFVRDNGMGIPSEFHEHIFGLFNKLDPNSEGTGVGLALVKRIVEFHGGRIWVESEAGMGATFLFTLPSKPESDSVI